MTGGDKSTEDAVDLDRQHFMKTLAAFRFFGLHSLKRVERARAYYKSFTKNQQRLIREFEDHMKRVEKCINHNNDLIAHIIQHSAPDIFNGEHAKEMLTHLDNSSTHASLNKTRVENVDQTTKFGPFAFTNSDMDKVRSMLKQFVRDWSSEGKAERDICYKPVIEEIKEIYTNGKRDLSKIRILVPGAGLGRLAWELAHHGFTCQGNEWSLHMLIPAYFVLNTCKKINEYTIYPWVSQFCNNVSRRDQIAPVSFPDVCPADLPPDVQFSMAAGDFVEIYTEPNSWDCVATVFFIDTAHNILTYLETIWQILKPGGYWINFGPLLYHFSDIPGEESLELSYEEVALAIHRLGFELVKENRNIQCGYTQNPVSMLAYNYNCVYGVYRKPGKPRKLSGSVDHKHS